MATETVLRPSATSSGVGWTPSAGSLHSVTSDDSDATYATWSGDGSALILATPADAPPAGERRHQVRLRARGEDGSAWWAVRLSSGSLVAGAAALFGASPETIDGSWGFGVPADGSTVLHTYVTGQSSGVRITELYLDVDSREAPTFTPQVLDGSDAVTAIISDTAQPTVRADSLDTDGLAARQYRFWVTLDGVTVWDTGVVSGSPVNRQTTALDNGAYVAHLQVWSTLGANMEYASDEETLAFTVAAGQIDPPASPVVTEEAPFYVIEVCAPDASGFDDEQAWIEVQRVDCEPAEPMTLAIVGPLATEECAEWTDWTAPRSGAGATCDHDPGQCCSYYRARTVARVDGALLVSTFSDFFDPGAVLAGVSFPWPGEAASIPAGWSRVDALDDTYARGVPDGATDPGATGGSADHDHTTAGHVHTMSHFHVSGGDTSAAVGSVPSHDGAAGTTAIAATHVHTRSATNAAVPSSVIAAPGTDAVANDPDHLEVIWISSDGTPTGVPDGALAPMGDVAPAGWNTYPDATGRFLKGAAPAGDGGATASGALDGHVHAVDAHTHAGTSHNHTSPNVGSVSSDRTLFAGPNNVTWATSHSHPVTIGSATSGGLSSGSGGTSGAAGSLPYTDVRVRQNDTGGPDLPVGVIGLWRGELADMPPGWALCDGDDGRPDLLGRFPRGATSSIGAVGGSPTHDHTAPSAHGHAVALGHVHPMTIGASTGATANTSATATLSVATGTHAHTGSDTGSSSTTVGTSAAGTLAESSHLPPFEEVAFIQLTEVPQPPASDLFCLEWSEDEHLIRTTGPDGPMWAPVFGKFDWTVERPFTEATGVMGSRFVVSAPPGGRNMRMTAAVESDEELATLREVLARPLVLVSPSDASEVWAAPVQESVRVVKVGRIRQVTAAFIGTGPEPPPQPTDVGS